MKLAYITKTLGLNLYIIKGIDLDDVSMTRILFGASLFARILIVGLAIVIAFPPAGS